ncbi:hypothetical protein [Nesterenkonia muleiensis]|uniref:hypothetical protein n=1 Tax=Nesterenkonia muleiensis TaxID=2282648 RepID=UPI000E7701C1|nr:hypothetical protein [Nesterenkonia muleiensis]
MKRISRTTQLAAVLSLTAVTACGSSDPEPRPLTNEEAELLAISRFNNFDAGTRGVQFSLNDFGDRYSFEGWFDYITGTGYGELSLLDNDGAVQESSLMLWNEQVVGYYAAGEPWNEIPEDSDAEDTESQAPLPIPGTDELDAAWDGGPLDPSASRIHTLFAVVGSLGSERPDNPLLLQQGGALWLSENAEGSGTFTLFGGPAAEEEVTAGEEIDPDEITTRFLIDEAGVMSEAEVLLSGDEEWTTIVLSEAGDVDLGDPFGEAETTGQGNSDDDRDAGQ